MRQLTEAFGFFTMTSPQLQPSKPQSLVEVEKYCRRCKDCWPITFDFWGKDAKQKDGLTLICKACTKDQKLKLVCPLEPEVPSKACSCCNKIKPATSACFMPMPDTRDGFSGQCRECKNRVKRERAAAIRAGISRTTPFVPTADTVYTACTACGIEKPQDAAFFHRSPVTKSGLLAQCKVCTNAARKKRRAFPGVTIVLSKAATGGRPRRVSLIVPDRVCVRCEVSKPLTAEFWKPVASGSNDFETCCKACDRAARKKTQDKLRECGIKMPMAGIPR